MVLDERLIFYLMEIWDYFVENKIWVSSFTTLSDFRAAVDFPRTLESILKHGDINTKKTTGNAKSIQNRWDMSLEETIPINHLSSNPGYHFTREIRRLTGLYDRVIIIDLLKKELQMRKVRPPIRGIKNPIDIFRTIDIQRILVRLKGKEKEDRIRESSNSDGAVEEKE